MKTLLYSMLFAFAGSVSAQNVHFSYTVDNSDNIVSIISVYAQATQPTNNEMIAFGVTVYYDINEATVTLPADVDFQGATDFGWIIGSNTTVSNNADNNPLVPTTHTHYIEVAPLDEGFAGTPIPFGSPTLFFTITFNKTVGDPTIGGETYLGATDTNGSLAGADENFEPFDIVATGARTQVLPLDLISFKSRKEGLSSSRLNWVTANEINTSHFSVQRSTDRKTWTTIGKVAAAGNSQLVENYQFLDENVYNGVDTRLTVYYRLQMFDLDGRNKLSPIESVTFGTDAGLAKSFEAIVYPNPASEGLQVEWDANNIDQPTLLEFYDVTGKLVYQQKVSDNTNQEYIDFGPAQIQPGLYLLRILNGTDPLDHKQIVVGQNR